MAEKILIVDDDLDTLRLVGLMLQKQGYQIIAASSGAQGLELAFSELPELILLDVMMPGMDGYEVARRLRADPKTVNTPILMFTAKSQLDDKVTGFESGADDYLTKPTHPTELHAHVKALLARSSKSKVTHPATGPTQPPAYTIGVLAARGGLGVTTVASNLAGALVKKTNLETILVEFCPGKGTLGFDLNLAKTTGLVELLGTPATEITRGLVGEKLVKHLSGVSLLPASTQPKDALFLDNVQQFEVILNRLEFMSRYVVVDLGSTLGQMTQKLAPAFDELLIIVEPFENSLQHARALLADLPSVGVDKSRLRVVVNYRIRSDTQLSVPQVQERIQSSIEVTFTPAPELMHHAARLHTLACLVQEDSLTSQQYSSLALKIEARAPKPTPK